MQADIDKLDINKLVNIPTGLNNLETKVDDSDVGNVKAVPINLKKLSDLVGKEVVKNTKFKKLNTKVNNSEKKILDATTFIHINQFNTGNPNLPKKIRDKKYPKLVV